MFFFNNLKVTRRHQFRSITRASIISYLYYNLFFRNISVQALSSARYARIVSIFDSTSKFNNVYRNLFNNRNYLYIEKLCISSYEPQEQTLFKTATSTDISYDDVFKKSIMNMDQSENTQEPEWVSECKSYNHDAFENLGSLYLPGLGVVATNYKHKTTGFSVMSLKTHPNSGKEMCFDLCVPTPPLNSKGSPHVLEHSVLAGTPNYPSKDSISILDQVGFTSFLNASTYKDRTSYVFASTNEKSFYQVADFYIDSFFRPNISHDKMIFNQECWHFRVGDESTDKTDADITLHGRNIGYAGIVYSEMKKAFSDTSTMFSKLIYENLFTNSYQYVSGGDPAHIVDLSHRELVDFYKLYYGPKTSTLYLYGPYELKNRLDFVDNYLRTYNIGLVDPKTGAVTHDAETISANSHLDLEQYKDKPKHVTSQFGTVNENEDEFMIAWLLDPVVKDPQDKYKIDFVDNVAFQVLSYLLMGTPESVLYRSLIDSGFGKKVTGYGFSSGYRQSTFSVGVKGVDNQKNGTKEEMVKKFEKIVFDTFERVKQEGFKRDAIDSGINLVEFEMRELNTGYYPKGLMLISLMQTQLQYGNDPFGLLRFDHLMSELKKRVFDGNPSDYFVNLLVKHFVNNHSRVTVHLEAVESTKFEKEMNKKISEQLKSRLSHLSREEVDRMEEEYKKFKEDREKPQDPKSYNEFPTVELSEFLNETKSSPTRFYNLSEGGLKETKSVSEATDVRLFAHKVDSNQVLYMDYAVPLDSLSLEEVRYMNLFCRMLNESGTDKLTPEEVSYLVDKNLGGLSFSTFFTTESNNETYDDPNKGLGYLFVRTKSLKSKTDKMVDVVNDLLLNANFSNSKKGVEILKRTLSQMQTGMQSNGSEYSLKRVAAKFSVARYADEAANGYSQLVFLKDTLLPLADKDWKQVEERLNLMRQNLLSRKNLTVNLTGDAELVEAFLNNASSFYNRLSSTFKNESSSTDKVWVREVLDNKLMEKMDKNELLVMPVRNNFVGVGGKLFSKSDKMSGEHRVVTQYVMRSFLYRYLRSSGSSYGAHLYLLNTGHVAMVSYADPNFLQTLEVYKKVPEELSYAYSKLNRKAVKMHILGTLGTMDKEPHPVDKSLALLKSNLRGETAEFASSYRKGVLATTNKAFKELAEKFKSDYDWLNVCSLVNRASADTSPPTFKRLY